MTNDGLVPGQSHHFAYQSRLCDCHHLAESVAHHQRYQTMTDSDQHRSCLSAGTEAEYPQNNTHRQPVGPRFQHRFGYIMQLHTYIRTLDNAHNSQAQGFNLRRGRSLGGKKTVDINYEQTDGILDEIGTS